MQTFNGVLISSSFTEYKDPGFKTAYTEHSLRRIIISVGLRPLYIGWKVPAPTTFKRLIYLSLRHIWIFILRCIFILERGYDEEIPVIWSKKILIVAKKSV